MLSNSVQRGIDALGLHFDTNWKKSRKDDLNEI